MALTEFLEQLFESSFWNKPNVKTGNMQRILSSRKTRTFLLGASVFGILKLNEKLSCCPAITIAMQQKHFQSSQARYRSHNALCNVAAVDATPF